MPFNLFHKKKPPEPETTAISPPEEPNQETLTSEAPITETMPQEETLTEPAVAPQEQPSTQEPAPSPSISEPTAQQAIEATPEQPPEPVAATPQEPKPAETPNKTYLKAMPLRELVDVENVKNEVRNGNIIILKVTPLASKSIEDVKTAVNDLYQFAESSGGDIARLGEERVVICPKTVRIWREKTPAPVVTGQGLPTSAA